jgi:uncharacterized protein YndB with AHSA1/START domain
MTKDGFGEVRAAGEAFELIFQRRLAKSVDKVWAALTTPGRLADWLAQAEVELRVGGRFELFWPTHDFRMKGVIVALEAPRLIAWTWPHENHPDSIVRWELAADGAGCLLTLTQSGLKPPLIDVAAGWHTHLECLPGAVDGVHTPWRAEREREIKALYEGRL